MNYGTAVLALNVAVDIVYISSSRVHVEVIFKGLLCIEFIELRTYSPNHCVSHWYNHIIDIAALLIPERILFYHL